MAQFRGTTLGDVAVAATACYRRRAHKLKSQERCNDLILEINTLKSEAGRLATEAKELSDSVDALRKEALEQFGFAVLAVVTGAVTAILRMERILRTINRVRRGVPLRSDILSLLSAIGPVASAIALLLGYMKLKEADRIERQANDLIQQAENLGEALLRAVDDYSQLGCGERGPFTGS